MSENNYLDELTVLQAELCKSFTNPVRIAIIRILAEGEKSVSQISSLLSVPVQNISQHMKILKENGIVGSRRDGHRIIYFIDNKKLLRVCQLMREALIEILKEKVMMLQRNIE